MKLVTKLFIILDVIIVFCFLLVYGPISKARVFWITTAMETGSHQYFAYIFYSKNTVNKVMSENKLEEINEETIQKFSETVKVGRIIVNSPSTHGAIGDIYNTNMPSLTLGCGSFGGNSTTSNVSSANLINIKKVAKRRVNMQWFKVPNKIYFEAGSIE